MDSKKRRLNEGEDDKSSASPDEIRRMLRCMTYDALTGLLVKLGSESEIAHELIRDAWNADLNNRKLYVRNLNWETSQETLEDYFRQYGEIVECAVIKDKNTGKNKGYGFVTYRTAEEARGALENPSPQLDNRTVSVSLAAAGKVATTPSISQYNRDDPAARKLFVRQLNFETDEGRLADFFSQYGEVAEVFIFRDKATNKSKGHAFVTFKNSDSAAAALVETNKTIDGRKAIVRLAAEGAPPKTAAPLASMASMPMQQQPQVQQAMLNPYIMPFQQTQVQGFPSAYNRPYGQ
eukprot:TRINITY_DN2074_c0_g1_i1.p1 TRINITY_DN2074_c0_g1~~TRINITY_DN2074_c0_g1_i1.p1  ORF type:complete len:293 (-),score=132.91 TRINITY_DN2074_c0_g1_i1:262-1140(-)